LIQEIVRDSLNNQVSTEVPPQEPARLPKSRQVKIWLFAFGLIAFGLFCITSIPPRDGKLNGVQSRELVNDRLPTIPSAAEPQPAKAEVALPASNVPLGQKAAGTPDPKPVIVIPEPMVAATIQEESKAAEVGRTTSKPLMPTHTKPEPLLKKEKNGAKAAHPKVASKIKPELNVPAAGSGANVSSARSETSSSQVSMGTSSGMPSQTMQSTTTSNKADACYGTNGLSREQCQQCDSRNGWLFKLNCEAQVKARFCAGREGKHVECPPSYHTPG
jgi:hypothetical protein